MVLQGASVADALNASRLQGTLQFVGQEALPPGMAYEQFIFETRCIPTRDNLHDFFNGLIWLHWPQLKQRLNALQAAEIARQGVGAQRGRLRDSITVLDENGGLLLAPQALCDALRDKLRFELGDLQSRFDAMGVSWPDVDPMNLYTVHDLHPLVEEELVRRGAMRGGLTWHWVRPPVSDIEIEIDARRVTRQRLLRG